ncbi:MAG: MFS transporter [Desulfobacteraceae bacterium]|nr:MAG: MFS transporter [Desulfobacteraceae bacterium]
MRYVLKDRNLILLFLASFLFFLNETLLLPTLPMVLFNLGYSNTQIGLTLGAFAVGVLVFRPLTAYITDQKSRKLSLYIGAAVFFIAPFLYLVSFDFGYLIGVRFFHGLGISFFTTASPALVSDLAPESHRAEILGHMGMASSFSVIIGPLIGVLIYQAAGIQYVLWACIVLGLGSIFLIGFIREMERSIDMNRKDKGYFQVLRNRGVAISSGLVLIVALMNGGIFTFLPVLVKNYFELNVGLIFTTISISLIVSRLLTAHLSDQYGRGPSAFYFFLILCLSYYLIGRSRSAWGLFGAAVLNGLGVGGCMPALIAHVVDNTDARMRGIAFSLFYGAFDVGMILGGAVLGFVADWTGLRAMYEITAVIGVMAVIGFALSVRPGFMQSLKWTLKGNPPYENI